MFSSPHSFYSLNMEPRGLGERNAPERKCLSKALTRAEWKHALPK